MKRVEEKRVEFPENVQFELSGKKLTVKGEKGEAGKKFRAAGIAFEKRENSLVLKPRNSTKKTYAVLNAVVAHVKNMAEGVSRLHSRKMVVVYSHFPISVSVKEKSIEIHNFAGEKRPRIAKIVGNTRVEVKGKEIILSSPSKEDLGQTAANIELASRVRGMDKRIFQDGVYPVRE